MFAERLLTDEFPADRGRMGLLQGIEGNNLSSRSSEIKRKLQQFWQKDVSWDCPLAKFTTLRVGGPAAGVVFPSGEEEIGQLVAGLNEHGIPWRVMGRGSNILAPDEGFAGIVLVLGRQFAVIETVSAQGDFVQVRAEAGCGLGRLVNWCKEEAVAGLEFAVGIPGSVGGAIIMNAGAWGKEICEVLSSVRFLNAAGEFITKKRQELAFSYRHLETAQDEIVLSGVFDLHKGVQEEIAALCRDYTKRRKMSQPQRVASAGSFFKNPEGRAAGRLIEQAGLKGFKIGGAMVSEIHANFLINTGNATAKDFYKLMGLVQAEVLKQTGVLLEPEVDIWPVVGEH